MINININNNSDGDDLHFADCSVGANSKSTEQINDSRFLFCLIATLRLVGGKFKRNSGVSVNGWRDGGAGGLIAANK